MEEKISIKRENVLTAYEGASKEQKTLLENMFGKDVFQPKSIMERVKTFEDACEELGEDHQYVKAYREWMRVSFADCKDITAYLKLRIICTALNDGWKLKFAGNEFRYYPWFYIYPTKEGYEKLNSDEKKECRAVGRSSRNSYVFGCIVSASASIESSYSFSVYVPRFALKTRELAEYCSKQFIDIWGDYLFA